MDPADWQLLQAIALGSLVAWASGLRLYLVVFVLGLAARLGYLDAPRGPRDPLARVRDRGLGVPPGGRVPRRQGARHRQRLGRGAHLHPDPRRRPPRRGRGGDDLTAITVAAGLLGGTITAGTHFAKAGGRAVINTSPEPFSNWVASFTEDAMVLGGIWVALQLPGWCSSRRSSCSCLRGRGSSIAFARFVRRAPRTGGPAAAGARTGPVARPGGAR